MSYRVVTPKRLYELSWFGTVTLKLIEREAFMKLSQGLTQAFRKCSSKLAL